MTQNGLKWLEFGSQGVTPLQKRDAKMCQKGAKKFFFCFKELDVRKKSKICQKIYLKVSKSGSKCLQMSPNDTKWLEMAPNGSKSVKQLNKNAKRSHTVSKSFVIFEKEPKKIKSAKNC